MLTQTNFQHPKVEDKDISFNRIQSKIQQLQSELDQQNIPITLHSGAEVFYLPNLSKIKDNKLATFGNGKYMLIEFQPHLIPDTHQQQLFDLKMLGVTPIIAHPERYKQVQQNETIVSKWMEAGCLIQIDAGSVLGYLGTNAEKTAINLLKKGWCHILGSDAHDDKRRNFCLKDALHKLNNSGINNLDNLVNQNPEKVLNGDVIQIEVDYTSMDEKRTFLSRIKDRIGLS